MFDVDNFLNDSVRLIKDQIVGNAIVACSGGLDSTIVAIVANRAVGPRSTAVFVDTGFIRIREKENENEGC